MNTGKNVTAEDFVSAWQTGTTLQDVAAKLGITPQAASGRAGRYRKAGIELQDFKHLRGSNIDVEALNKLALSLKAA